MRVAFDNTFVSLPPEFYAEATPSAAVEPTLIAFNEGLAGELGIDRDDATDAELAELFSGARPFEGACPIATVYAGHQFGHPVPRLGDGRAILLGEVVGTDGRRRDIQLKGAGRTAYSRGGDGRSPLGPVLREYLVSEAMHALGVPTTRALAAVATGDVVVRDRPLPGAVFTRVAASHRFDRRVPLDGRHDRASAGGLDRRVAEPRGGVEDVRVLQASEGGELAARVLGRIEPLDPVHQSARQQQRRRSRRRVEAGEPAAPGGHLLNPLNPITPHFVAAAVIRGDALQGAPARPRQPANPIGRPDPVVSPTLSKPPALAKTVIPASHAVLVHRFL